MSENEKLPEPRIRRMVDESKPDNQFGYRPPKLHTRVQQNVIEERGYVPPRKPKPPSGSTTDTGSKKAPKVKK